MNNQAWIHGTAPRPQQRLETHVLNVKQEPERAKVVVRGKEKDRKPIDPPPIVQLEVFEQYPPTTSFVHNPYYFCCCSLWDANRDQAKLPEGNDPQPLLVGSTVSSLHRLKDLSNREGGYFVFGDVSAGVQGRYRLRFSLYELRPRYGDVVYLRSVISQPFDVASPKEWDGVKESTILSRSFADQGVRLRLRKESRNAAKRAFAPPYPPTSSAPHTPTAPTGVSQPGSYGSHSSEETTPTQGEPSYKRQRSYPTTTLAGDYPQNTVSQSYQHSAQNAGWPSGSGYSTQSQPSYNATYPYNSGQYSQYAPSAYAPGYPSTSTAYRTNPQTQTQASTGPLMSPFNTNVPPQQQYGSQVPSNYSYPPSYGTYPPSSTAQASTGSPAYGVAAYGAGSGQPQSQQQQQQRTNNTYTPNSPYTSQQPGSTYFANPAAGAIADYAHRTGSSASFRSSVDRQPANSVGGRTMANPASVPVLAPIQHRGDGIAHSIEAEDDSAPPR